MRNELGWNYFPQFGVIAAILLFLGQYSVRGEITGEVRYLTLIADGVETNLEKLKTWRGKVSVSAYASAIPGLDRREKEWIQEGEFLVDRDAHAIRWHTIIPSGFEISEGGRLPLRPQETSGMIKEQFDYRVTFPDKKDWKRSMLIRQAGKMPRNIEGDMFDPVFILTREVYPDLVGQLRFYHEKASSPKINGEVKRRGDIVSLETASNRAGLGELITRFSFHLGKGCALMEFSTKCDLTAQSWRLDYDEVEGVFVPTEISSVYNDYRPGQERTSKRHAVLTTHMINKPVDPGEFEFGKIGMRPGDMIYDRVAGGLSYIWRGEESILEQMGESVLDTEEIVSADSNPMADGSVGREVTVASDIQRSNSNPFQTRSGDIARRWLLGGVAAVLVCSGCIGTYIYRKRR